MFEDAEERRIVIFDKPSDQEFVIIGYFYNRKSLTRAFVEFEEAFCLFVLFEFFGGVEGAPTLDIEHLTDIINTFHQKVSFW